MPGADVKLTELYPFSLNNPIVKLCLFEQSLSHVQLFATPWAVASQAPLSMGFSRHEYWIGLSFPPTGALPDPGIERASLAPPALAGRFFATAPPGKLPV